jgi:hypothetical protein
MSSTVLHGLEIFLIALIWLFFLRVVRAAWVQTREPPPPPPPEALRDIVLPTAPREASPQPAPPPAAAPHLPTNGQAPGGTPGIATGAGSRPRSSVAAPPAEGGGRLRVVGPDGAERSTDIRGETTVGRAPGCGIALADDKFASSLHARLWVQGGRLWVEDLGSTNGTWLNGERLAGPRPLSRGDRVQVGRTVLEVAR